MNWISVNINGDSGVITVKPSNDRESFEFKTEDEFNSDKPTLMYLSRDELVELKTKLEVLLDFTR